jgi:hypothetical protein
LSNVEVAAVLGRCALASHHGDRDGSYSCFGQLKTE